MTHLKDYIFSLLQKSGSAAVGIADLRPADKAMDAHCDPKLKRYDRAVSFAVSFPRSVIDELQFGPSLTYLHFYRAVNALIDDMSIRLTTLLEEKGYEAFPVPSSQRTGKNKLDSIFPHRIAAYLAGIGWIGKSGCIIHKSFGPRLRLGTVLTSAPLPPDVPLNDQCGQCTDCARICPAGAILGINFAVDIPVSERLLPERCDNYQNEVRDKFGKRVCGMCLAICPYGKSSVPHNGQ